MKKIFINAYNKRPLIVSRGSKSYLYANKKKYLDFLSGISINNIGYGNKKIIQRIVFQAKKIIHPSNYYYTKVQIELAKKLINISGLDKIFFANSGSEANETALFLLSKYKENIFPNRNEIIIIDGSFFGRTYGCQRLSSGLSVGKLKVKKVSFNNLSDFKDKVSGNSLAVCLELVLGHGGVKPMDVNILNQIAKICKSREILVYIDEVQTGLGRVGETFAFKLYKLNPDIVTIGKSLGGGLPLSATIVKEKLARNIKPGDYGSTMGGNSIACAAGNILIDYLSNPKNIQKIKKKGAYITEKINDLIKKYPHIKEVRGLGLMIGVELAEKADLVLENSLKNGLLLDIVAKNTLRLLPPFNISKKDIDLAIEKLMLSLAEVYL
jgi:acetylornithine/N-succinyldiaminopimelate aminotransferase